MVMRGEICFLKNARLCISSKKRHKFNPVIPSVLKTNEIPGGAPEAPL